MKASENILLLGLGGVGRYLAKRLSFEGHAVTVIERSRAKIEAADSELDARLVLGDALDFDAWSAARASSMDYLIAVTDDDAVNILAANIAHRLGIPKKIVRARTMRIWDSNAPVTARDLHIDLVIRPSELASQEIARLMMMRTGNALVDVGDGHLQVVATHVSVGGVLAGKHVRDVAEDAALKLRIVCVARGIETLVPTGDFVLEPHDHIYVLTTRADARRVMDLAGIREAKQQEILIVGASVIGIQTAELLEDKYPVRLLERDEVKAEETAYRLKKTQVLRGDGSDSETLTNAGLLRADTIVTATGDNETNVMSGVLAKHLIATRTDRPDGCRSIVCVSREQYATLATALGADVAVSAKALAANRILRYIRKGHVLSVAHLHGCDAEVMELLADEGSPITASSLAEQPELKGRVNVGAVFRQGCWKLAYGDTHIQPGERAVCICTSKNIRDLQRLFFK